MRSYDVRSLLYKSLPLFLLLGFCNEGLVLDYEIFQAWSTELVLREHAADDTREYLRDTTTCREVCPRFALLTALVTRVGLEDFRAALFGNVEFRCVLDDNLYIRNKVTCCIRCVLTKKDVCNLCCETSWLCASCIECVDLCFHRIIRVR